MEWPTSIDELMREQVALAAEEPPPWSPGSDVYSIGGCFVCFPRGESGEGAKGDPGWAGAAVVTANGGVFTSESVGAAGAPYAAGLLALREGPLLAAAVCGLAVRPEVLLVNATGRDHPRRAGLALHLGALLGLPTVGITHRTLLAEGPWPEPVRGARSPLMLEGDLVGYWLGTRPGTRPLAVHAAWRTDPETALAVALRASAGGPRTPEPLRQARRVAREARAEAARAADP